MRVPRADRSSAKSVEFSRCHPFSISPLAHGHLLAPRSKSPALGSHGSLEPLPPAAEVLLGEPLRRLFLAHPSSEHLRPTRDRRRLAHHLLHLCTAALAKA